MKDYIVHVLSRYTVSTIVSWPGVCLICDLLLTIVVPVFFVTEGERVTGAMGLCEDSSWVLIGYLWLWLASDCLTQVHCCDTAQRRRNSCVLDHNNDWVHFITMSSALVSRDIFVMR